MDKTILLGHGSGGKMTSDLINSVFVKYFDNDILQKKTDSALLNIETKCIAFTTDSYVVDPVFFPGGDIGKLAVCGTVNDLAVSGAKPLYLSAGFIIEEGFALNQLEEICMSIKTEATKANVFIVTGDTKVVKRGQCDKIFINTSGIGIIDPGYVDISEGKNIKTADKLIVNGFIGDHSIAVMGARENIQFETEILSDVAPLNGLIQDVLNAGHKIKFMRDLTRGGLATVLAEIVENNDFGIVVNEVDIPIRESVKGLCEIFGYDPLYLANEGKVLFVVEGDHAENILQVIQQNKYGTDARIIGEVTSENISMAILKSVIGGKRIIDKLAGEQLPRIC
ncbi:MAG: hydrogenase expression/formation protein HypE [Prolixibacteraceae bacterium]|nr:hydrogenase expression/formation protein HypE [Prolixibacteraceae bacterium]